MQSIVLLSTNVVKYVGMNLPPLFLMSANTPKIVLQITVSDIRSCSFLADDSVTRQLYAIKGHSFLQNYQ